MVTIKNRMNQPYTLNLKDGTSLIVHPKEEFKVTLENFDSDDIKNNIAAKHFIVISM